MRIRNLVRHGLAMVLVAFPSAYVIWQWSNVTNPVLPSMSYASVNETLAGDRTPAFWTYAIWVLVLFAVMSVLTHLVNALLRRVFPDAPCATH